MDSFGIASLIMCLSFCLTFIPPQQTLAELSPSSLTNSIITDPNLSKPEEKTKQEEASKQEEISKQKERSKQEEIYQLLLKGKIPHSIVTNYQTPEEPTVYLTFDDGPSKLTWSVLDILKDEEVKGTFFMVGEQAQSYPDLVKRVVREGHAIGNHSYNHVYKELYEDYDGFWKQIKQNEQILFHLSGSYSRLLRAPGGTSTNFDAFYFYYLEQAGYIVMDWNVDCGDSARRNVPASEIIQNVKKAPLRHEMNVLIHDGSGHHSSVQALKEIIRYFKNNGYTFAPLSSEVKPMQFPVAATKWKRDVSFARFLEFDTDTRAYASVFSQTHILSE
ncbi:polysaccharide deacetylase family protein [Paenibacillus sp. GP183]|uniref:polysaccharide deacetylase family protein n=1 Tax=Paenibacillus sp. GP183 TaxID=1882751 RepID=UPI000895332D|nr:polysaccharide deacetylase family protein [Paenibacillus sp. GP183]SEC52631.1 Peptidoglycan/xylan/chitin deacetylase, PgdA/CDA1 family [Paenibacillus sp. GP183]